MYRKALERVHHRHLVYVVVLFLVLLLVATIITYRQSVGTVSQFFPPTASAEDKMTLVSDFYFQQRIVLIISFALILLVGIVIDIIVHVARRDGFRDGFKRALHDPSSKVI
jgi:predicted exporter